MNGASRFAFRSLAALLPLACALPFACTETAKAKKGKAAAGTIEVGDGKGGPANSPTIAGGGEPEVIGGGGTLILGTIGTSFSLLADTPRPDKVCAQQTHDGWNSHKAMCVDIGTDGTFAAPVNCDPKGEASRCVFLLVNSTLPRKERVLGFVSLNGQQEAGDSLLLFSSEQISKDIDLGVLTRTGDEGLSATTLTQAEGSFTISRETLILQARADNMLKNAKNMFINTKQDFDSEGFDYVMTQRFYWDSNRLADVWAPSGVSTDSVAFSGYALQGTNYDPDFLVDAIRPQAQTIDIRLKPPADVEAYNFKTCQQDSEGCARKTFTASEGLRLDAVGTLQEPAFHTDCYTESPKSLCVGHFNDMMVGCATENSESPPPEGATCIKNWDFEPRPRAHLGFGSPLGNFQTRVPGLWELIYGGSPRAWWDLDLAFPVADFAQGQRTTIPVPILQAETDPSHRLTKVILTWKMVNPETGVYEAVTDSSFMKTFLNGKVMLGISGDSSKPLCREGYFRTGDNTNWPTSDFSRLELTSFLRDPNTPDEPFSDKWYSENPPAGDDNCLISGFQVGFGLDGSDASFWFHN